jgi:DNA-binding PadR family transcriptional regulator
MRRMELDDLLSGSQQELRRGTLVLACLLLLRRPGYGYALLDELRELGFVTDANTLYPMLRRLESRGVLDSEWNTDESRPRKFYQTNRQGEQLAAELMSAWKQLDAAVRGLDRPAHGDSR